MVFCVIVSAGLNSLEPHMRHRQHEQNHLPSGTSFIKYKNGKLENKSNVLVQDLVGDKTNRTVTNVASFSKFLTLDKFKHS